MTSIPSKEELKQKLTAEQFEVTQNKATEAPFTGIYWNTTEPGVYNCVVCNSVLFTSNEKFDSGCGWPSFFDAANLENIETEVDVSHGMVRTEVHCKVCKAHLGHIFNDGPKPTGLRYCINSASINLNKNESPEIGDKLSFKI